MGSSTAILHSVIAEPQAGQCCGFCSTDNARPSLRERREHKRSLRHRRPRAAVDDGRSVRYRTGLSSFEFGVEPPTEAALERQRDPAKRMSPKDVNIALAFAGRRHDAIRDQLMN